MLPWPLGQVVKTSPFHGGIMGSNPVGVTTYALYGQIAQSVEQRTENPRVDGSIPSLATRCKAAGLRTYKT